MSFSRSLKEKSREIWEKSYQHSFVQELGAGTLPLEKFQFYLLQDYVYLLEYGKVFALGMVKSPTEKLMDHFTTAQYGIIHNEMDMHRQYMREFGMDENESEKIQPSIFNQAYTANMISVAQTGDLAELIATVFPCAWSYYDFGCRLKKDYEKMSITNPYHSWIEMYSSSGFYQSFEWFFDVLDELCERKNEAEKRKIEEIFRRSMEFEYLFWEMAYKKQIGI